MIQNAAISQNSSGSYFWVSPLCLGIPCNESVWLTGVPGPGLGVYRNLSETLISFLSLIEVSWRLVYESFVAI